jgi:hypothetical protein
MKPILILFSLALLVSCSKEKIKMTGENAFLKGEYEWVYSYGENNESESFETYNDRYALVIKENGKAEVWNNGERIEKGYVASISDFYGTKYANFVFDSGNRTMRFNNNSLESYSYPIADHTNIFQKQ